MKFILMAKRLLHPIPQAAACLTEKLSANPHPIIRQRRGESGLWEQWLFASSLTKPEKLSPRAPSAVLHCCAAAINAARQARFTPTLLSGQPVKVTGTISYNFILQ